MKIMDHCHNLRSVLSKGTTQIPTLPVVSGVSIPPVQPSTGFLPTTTVTELTPGIPVMVRPTPQGTLPSQQIPGSYNQGTYVPRPYLQGTPIQDASHGSYMQTQVPYLGGGMYNVTDYRLYPQLNEQGPPPFNPSYREMQGMKLFFTVIQN